MFFLFASLVLAVAFGSDSVSLAELLNDRGHARVIIFELRLREALLAAVAGAGLALVGAAFQALMQNPLAEPFVLGVSGGAALGATVAIASGLATTTLLGAAVTPVFAFLGGLAATVIVELVAARAPRGESGAAVLLAGVMVNSICAALITVGKLLVPPERARHMLSWLAGFVEVPSTRALVSVALYAGVGLVVLMRDAGPLNLLSLGDETAASLGVDVRALERRVVLASSLIVGAIVSMTGIIGFLGLVVPHVLRRVYGPDLRVLLPASALWGASALCLCDLGSRVLFGAVGTKLPVGALTALVGGPLFLHLLARGAAPSSRAT
ncbi:MAG: iron ABC transporter permease [Myxococcales bacterium]|nr:iron ABC transporter permease [Myxococcales bacterium]